MKSKIQLRNACENPSIAVAVLDADGSFVSVNETMADLFGFSREELLELKFTDITCEDDLQQSRDLVGAMISGRIDSGRLEKRYIHKSGRIVWGDLSVGTLKGDEGELEGFIVHIVDITERKRAEEAIRHERDKTRQFVDVASVMLVALDTAGNITLMNPKGCEILGYTSEEVIGRNWFDDGFLVTDQLEEVKKVFTRIISGELEPVEFYENEVKRKDGSERIIAWHNSILRGDDGCIAGLFSSGQDVTGRRQYEEELELTKKRLELAIESSNIGLWDWDLTSGKAVFSPVMLRQIGYGEGEIEESFEEWRDRLHPECREKVLGLLGRYLDGKIDSISTEYRWLHRDGSYRWIMATGEAYGTDDGKPDRMLGCHVDITERKRSEEILRESEEKYRSLVENTDLGIALISTDMKILSINRQMKEWFPHVDESIRPTCYKAFNDPPSERPCDYCPVVKVYEDGEAHESVTATPSEQGIRNYRVAASPVLDEDGNIMSVIETVEDITVRLKMDEELKKQAKLETIGALAGGIAHDFNNLLTTVKGNISLAMMDCERGSDMEVSLSEAAKATVQASKLTKRLLTFATGGEPVMEAVSIEDVLVEAVGFGLHGSKVDAEFSIEDDLKLVEADQGQINQVVNNIVLNAVQAMPRGGTIKVTAENHTVDSDHTVPGLGEGEYVRISVADKGVGIPANLIDRVFDPFVTTKEQGNGLGLASCYSIIRNHGGMISIRSIEGEGTDVIFELPVSTRQQPDLDETAIEISGGTGRVLIVDDEESILKLARGALSKYGYDVETASDGREAVRLYADALSEDKGFDLVILDLTIPGGMGGKETLSQLGSMDPSVRAVVSSGYSNDTIMSQYAEHGFSACLPKPFEVKELVNVVQRVLEEDRLDIEI